MTSANSTGGGRTRCPRHHRSQRYSLSVIQIGIPEGLPYVHLVFLLAPQLETVADPQQHGLVVDAGVGAYAGINGMQPLPSGSTTTADATSLRRKARTCADCMPRALSWSRRASHCACCSSHRQPAS